MTADTRVLLRVGNPRIFPLRPREPRFAYGLWSTPAAIVLLQVFTSVCHRRVRLIKHVADTSRYRCWKIRTTGSLFSQLRAEMLHHAGEFFDVGLEILNLLLHAAAPNMLLLKLNDSRGSLRDRAAIAARRPA